MPNDHSRVPRTLPSVIGFLLSAALAIQSAVAIAQTPTRKPAPGDDLRPIYATAQEVAEGRKVAEAACQRCHGANGISVTRGVPHLAAQRAGYLYAQLRSYQKRPKTQSSMEGAVRFLRDDALVAVSAYYASLEPPRATPPSAKPVMAESDPVLMGKAAAAACSGCHGETGVSSIPGMPSLVSLDQKYFIAAMTAYKSGQRKNDVMKPFAAAMNDPTVSNVALYYALQKPARAQTPAAGDAGAGKKAAASCGGCHGDTGVSSSPGTPSLAGQDAQYLVAATLAYKDGSRNDETMKSLAAALEERALKDIAAFYAAQQPQPLSVRKPLTLGEWVERCDRCHGANGNSSDPMIPALASQRADWLEVSLDAYRTGARKSNAMAAMSTLLGEADVRTLAAHYARQAARPVVYVQVPARDAGTARRKP